MQRACGLGLHRSVHTTGVSRRRRACCWGTPRCPPTSCVQRRHCLASAWARLPTQQPRGRRGLREASLPWRQGSRNILMADTDRATFVGRHVGRILASLRQATPARGCRSYRTLGSPMPIVEVEVVCHAEAEFHQFSAAVLADALGRIFGSQPGTAWVKLRFLSETSYAENESTLGDLRSAGVRFGASCSGAARRGACHRSHGRHRCSRAVSWSRSRAHTRPVRAGSGGSSGIRWNEVR